MACALHRNSLDAYPFSIAKPALTCILFQILVDIHGAHVSIYAHLPIAPSTHIGSRLGAWRSDATGASLQHMVRDKDPSPRTFFHPRAAYACMSRDHARQTDYSQSPDELKPYLGYLHICDCETGQRVVKVICTSLTCFDRQKWIRFPQYVK